MSILERLIFSSLLIQIYVLSIFLVSLCLPIEFYHFLCESTEPLD